MTEARILLDAILTEHHDGLAGECYDALVKAWEGSIAAAVLAERERSAKVADAMAAEAWEKYKTGHGPERADLYWEGISDGAVQVAAAIRKGTP